MRVHLAPPGLTDVLGEELGARVGERHEDLFVVNDERGAVWAQNTWLDAQTFSFRSISQAASHLRSIQRNWWLHPLRHHRRAELIRQALPPIKPKAYSYYAEIPSAPLGSWALLDPNTLIYSARCSSPLPDGELNFVEDKNPPSRAYLKLWEYFTLCRLRPQPGELVLDLGSSPGGWTWVLDQLGPKIIAVDRAPFAETFRPSPRVDLRLQSAFALDPREVGPVDWLFSDVICYPERLLELVHRWLEHARNLVCTIKCQMPTNHAVIQKFLEIPDSEIRHLSCNKHELTWSRISALQEK